MQDSDSVNSVVSGFLCKYFRAIDLRSEVTLLFWSLEWQTGLIVTFP